MAHDKQSLNRNQQKRLLKMFLKAAGITLGICVILIGAVVGAYYGLIYDKKAEVTTENMTEEEKEEKEVRDSVGEINQTIAVFGVDEDEIRTDVIFVVNYNSKTNKMNILSIPRDTKVEWSQSQLAAANTQPYSGISKLNEMTAYGGIDNIRNLTINEIENLLGVTIDNYVIINIEAFNKIVDAIGGVDVEVPMDMYYKDKEQGLYIDLKRGYQHLDGKQAEGLVRFRYGYAEGDTGRIKTQHVFLKAFAEKVLSPSTLTKLPAIIPTLFSYVKTDVTLSQISDYLPLLKTFSAENMDFATVPGGGAYEGNVSYYFIDYTLLQETIRDTFYDTTVAGEEPEEETEPVENKNVSISIYNASGISGVAGKLQDMLQVNGYIVSDVGNYSQYLDTSVIKVKNLSDGAQFKQYVGEAVEVELDTTIDSDVEILIGKDTTLSAN